jgi:hypothetical protein
MPYRANIRIVSQLELISQNDGIDRTISNTQRRRNSYSKK